jgi:hypothetical protein
MQGARDIPDRYRLTELAPLPGEWRVVSSQVLSHLSCLYLWGGVREGGRGVQLFERVRILFSE